MDQGNRHAAGKIYSQSERQNQIRRHYELAVRPRSKIMLEKRGNSQNGPPPKLTDEEWALIRIIVQKPSDRWGRSCKNCRLSIEGMRWVASTAQPWAAMPIEFGNAASVKRYYARLNHRGVIKQLLTAFPETITKNDNKGLATTTAGKQLACLRLLTERKPRRGAARPRKQAESA